jgi:GldM C-terminal domain
MKKLLFLLLLCAKTALAQTTIAADKMNVVYIGVENPLHLAVTDAAFTDIAVSTSQGELTAQENGAFIWRVTDLKPSSIFVKNNKTAKIDTLNFRVKRIPDPVACFRPGGEGGHYSTPVQSNQGIVADLRNFEFEARCDIKSYTFTFLEKKGKPVVLTNTGARFEPAVLELIKSAKSGDTIYIENIKCHCPGDTYNRTLNDIVYKIK